MVFLVSTMVFGAVDLQSQLEVLNKEIIGQQVPPPLGAVFGNEKINVHIAQADDTEQVLSLVLEKKTVKSLSLTAVEKPTLNVYTDESTLQGILESSDQLTVLRQALDEGKITYKAVGFGNKMKIAFLNMFLKAGNFFGKKETAKTEEKINAKVEGQAEEKKENKGKSADEAEETAPESETEAEEETENEGVEESESASPTTAAVSEVKAGTTHTVLLTETGFAVPEITIKTGDTITWENTRTGRFKQGMIIGTQGCSKGLKSPFFLNGESFSWTFEKPGKCLIVDGIMTTQTMKVIIE